MDSETSTKRVHFEDRETKRMKTDEDNDVYDYLGRNITDQERRQEAMPWIKARYSRGKLVIGAEKKKLMENTVYLF